MAALGPETPEELSVKTDFRTNVWSVFQELYEDKWDQGSLASFIRLSAVPLIHIIFDIQPAGIAQSVSWS